MKSRAAILLDCVLCSGRSKPFANDTLRAYFRCSRCRLVFADPASRLDPSEEKARYGLHENDPSNASYRRFLGQLAEPLLSRLTPGMHGLDYGCGPGPTLSVMLQEAGMNVAIYDPYFAPNTSVLNREYDFVTCTEVAEHFNHPARDWSRLVRLLRPGGWLGAMTRQLDASVDFDQWYYKDDPTHVSFYSCQTLQWIAEHYRLRITLRDQSISLLQKL